MIRSKDADNVFRNIDELYSHTQGQNLFQRGRAFVTIEDFDAQELEKKDDQITRGCLHAGKRRQKTVSRSIHDAEEELRYQLSLAIPICVGSKDIRLMRSRRLAREFD
jgi:hypothetical protein